jgi:fatty acid desaturase
MQSFTDKQLREQARKRVEFRIHLFVYCVVNAALWIIWSVTGMGYVWPVWPMVGWGIGVLFHYMFDYRSSKFLSEEEEYKKLKEERDKHISTIQ